MFTQLMMRHGAMCLALVLSFVVAFAQTPVVNQPTRAQLSSAESESRSGKEDKQESKTEKEKQDAASLEEEMRRMRQLMEQMRQLIERQEARISRLEAEKSASAAKSAPATSEAAAPASKNTALDAPAGSQASGQAGNKTDPPAAESKDSSIQAQPPKLSIDDRDTLDFWRDTTVNVTVGDYYGYNFNRPLGGINLLRAHGALSNSFSLNKAGVIFEPAPNAGGGHRFRARLDPMFGFEQLEKRLAEVESRLAYISSMDKCQRAGAPTVSALLRAVAPALNTMAAVPISDVGESSQAPAKPGGVGISTKFPFNSILRGKNKKEPFAFADFTWLTGAPRTKVEAPSQPGSEEADKEAKIDKADKTDRTDDVDNAGKSEETGQSDKTNKGTAPASAGKDPPRRANPAPLDEVFPSTEYIGPTPLIGVPDTDPVYPLTEALWSLSPGLKKARIKVYGWVNPGISISTSDESNIPESYAIVPNKPQLDQGILRFERLPDTVQTDHVDWGFRFTTLYGIDYRWTTAQGWFSGQLLKRNRLYGVDTVETYGLIYVPKVAKGMLIKIGRYISPPDIEAQLAPDNYLFTHSLMFTYDCYTQTGVNAAVKLSDSWSILGGVHAGCDVAPWNVAAHPTGQFLARWVSKSNNDSIYGGINSINNGRYKGFHDNLQQSNITWTHRFNEKGTFVTSTEAYYIYQNRALVGGTVNFGPPRSWFRLTGPGALIPGNAPAIGVVNYTAIKISERNFITLRPIDYLVDVKGERTGFATTLSSWTVGFTHRFGKLIMIRPELRYEYAFSARPWDNGRKNKQFMFAMDAIIRF